MNMCEVPSTIKVKSVIAGEYTAPPAHGPMIRLICGTTPDASTLRRKISANRPSATTPSWIRAPPPSLMPITRQPVHQAGPGNHAIPVRAVGVHPEGRGPVPGQLVQLGERARVEQPLDPLP